MCLIVDANLLSRVFRDPPDDDFKPVIDWLQSEVGMLVYGGTKNAEELSRVAIAARFVRQLASAGHAYVFPNVQVDAEESHVQQLGLLRSDDPHILALARLSNARVLCSEDNALIDDFKTLEIVPRPRGKIYKRKEHANLLGHSTGCVGKHLARRRSRS